MLCRVTHAAAWFEQREHAKLIDSTYRSSAYCRNRESSRHVSISQYGTDGWLIAPPDNSAPTLFSSAAFEIGVARRFGLPIHRLVDHVAPTINADHDAYHSCLGDKECNTVEHNTRHHTVNRANYDMVRATATVPVLLGDKTQEQKYKLINKGRCYDIGLLAVPPKLKDILKDTKVTSFAGKAHHAGRGHGGAGTLGSVGHTHPFGNTEEPLRVAMLGTKQRGLPDDGAFV